MTDREPTTPADVASECDKKPRPRLFTIRGTAEELATSERSVWRLLGLGELTKVKVGRSVRITSESIDSFIRRGGAE